MGSRRPDDEQGVASGLINSSTQIGAAVVLAVVTAVATTRSGTHVSAASLQATFRPSLAVPIGVASLGLVLAAWSALRSRRTPRSGVCYAGAVVGTRPAAREPDPAG